MLFRKLYEDLMSLVSRMKDLEIESVDKLEQAVKNLSLLERSFLVVKSFATGLDSVLRGLETLRESVDSNKVESIAKSINAMVVNTRKASRTLRYLLLSMILLAIIASVAVNSLVHTEALRSLVNALTVFQVVIGGVIMLAVLMYLNVSVLLVPLIMATLLIENIALNMGSQNPLSISMLIASIIGFILSIVIVRSAVKSYRKALLTLMKIDQVIMDLVAHISKSKPSRPETVEKIDEDLLRATYGERYREILKYIEDVRRLRS